MPAITNIFNILGLPYELKHGSSNKFEIWGHKINLLNYIKIFNSKFCKERNPQLKDRLGRVIPSDKPIVYPELNPILKNIFTRINLKSYGIDMPLIQKWFWPRAAEFAVCVTHDIDKIRPTLADQKNRLNYLLSNDKRKIINFVLELMSKKNPWDPSKIANYDLQNDVKSSFYFRADKQTYDLERKYVKMLLADLLSKGFEIGLHGSFNSYSDEGLLTKEKYIIEKIIGGVHGVRQHYLRFDNPSTWVKQRAAGFLYDATYGFAQSIGYRGGVSFPFYPRDENNNIIDILEIPLTVMDCSLTAYLKLTLQESFKTIKKLTNHIMNYNGLITILWHNEYFEELVHPERRRLYELVIQYFKLNNSWFASGKMVYDWWVKRERQNIEALHSDSKLLIDVDKIKGGMLKIYLPRSWRKGEMDCIWVDSGIKNYFEVDKYGS